MSTQFPNITIKDECAAPLTDNSTHKHIQQNISLGSPRDSKVIQCNLCKKVVKSTRGLKLHQRSCINNLRDDKNKLLDEVSNSNNIAIRATEDNANKISKAPSEEYENIINGAYENMVFWKKNLFRLLSNSANKQSVDEQTT